MASPALVTDIPVLALLIVAWVTVPVFWAHLITGLALIALIGIHLLTRRQLPLRVGRARRRVAYGMFLAAAAAMAATGLLRWVGMSPQDTWHGGISYLALGLAMVHLWSVRRRLLSRIRTPQRGVRK